MENKLAVMPSKEEWGQLMEISKIAVESRLLPDSIKTKEQAAIIALKGRELGLPPMVSFSHIHVIQGKPTMSAEIMLAHIYKDHPAAEIVIVERSEKRCEIQARRPTETKLSTFVWDMDRATKMGLVNKENWKKQPGTMMFWRTITEMKRAKFPEVLMGIDYTKEEIEETITEKPVGPSVDARPAAAAEPQSIKTVVAKTVTAEVVEPKPAIKNHAPTPEQIAAKKAAKTEQPPPIDLVQQPGPELPEDIGEPSFEEVKAEVIAQAKALKMTPAQLNELCKATFECAIAKLDQDKDINKMTKLYEKLIEIKSEAPDVASH